MKPLIYFNKQTKFDLIAQFRAERGHDEFFKKTILEPITALWDENVGLQYCVDAETSMKIMRGKVGEVYGDTFEFMLRDKDGSSEMQTLSLYRVMAWRLLLPRRGPWHYTFMNEETAK